MAREGAPSSVVGEEDVAHLAFCVPEVDGGLLLRFEVLFEPDAALLGSNASRRPLTTDRPSPSEHTLPAELPQVETRGLGTSFNKKTASPTASTEPTLGSR